ncbi:hypothetical protein A0R60_1340 [Enterobacter asburiae]|uniref:LSU ribosomal protein L35p n=1 Tax=Citrobacter freundii TaxID=546 RepID=A0A7G2ITJ3_CITFR|nr:hypothetical protein A0R60_1340 [Enterobacter asburiae]EIQ80737.1 50S ribosomal protein L35 [Shigella flexneri 1235-66]CDL40265.1 LSU ribosomal protein L35p [Citrobacter freundii]
MEVIKMPKIKTVRGAAKRFKKPVVVDLSVSTQTCVIF